MSRLEKHAWFNIVIIVVAWLIFLAYPHNEILTVSAIMLVALGIPASIIIFLSKGKMSLKFDERERGIMRRAGNITGGILLLFFIISFYLVKFLHGGGNVIVFTGFTPMVIFFAIMFFFFVQSIVILVLSKMVIKHAE